MNIFKNPYYRILRIDHWIKNIFIFPGVFFALLLVNKPADLHLLYFIFIGFISVCFISSANYVLNEWLDHNTDKYHPTKKNRGLVDFDYNVNIILFEYFLCAGIGLILSFNLSKIHFVISIILLIMGLLYNVKPFRLKDIIYLDVLSESLNNALRLLLGWFIVTSVYLPPISLLLGYWFSGSFLMGIKRYAEYRMIKDTNNAHKYRKSFKYYTQENLLVSSIFYALLAVFLLGVSIVKYKIELILFIPFLCGLFCLYLWISFKKDSAVQKPEKLFREKFLMLYVTFMVILFITLSNLDIPQMDFFLNNVLIRISGN